MIKKTLNNFAYYCTILKDNVGISYFEPFFHLGKSKPQILVRVDEFPHWEKKFSDFLKFDKIMSKHKIPYLLAVVPFLSEEPLNYLCKKFRKLTKREIKFLQKKVKSNEIKIAMHGASHQTLYKDYYTEFIGLDKIELEQKIQARVES